WSRREGSRRRALRRADAHLRARGRSHARRAPARRHAVRVRAPWHRRAGAHERRAARGVVGVARAARERGARMTLSPNGALAPPRSGADEVFRRLGVGARKCDLGDQGLYLAEELALADRWLGGGDPEALAILVLALMIAQRQGSTRLPLDAKGPLRELVR